MEHYYLDGSKGRLAAEAVRPSLPAVHDGQNVDALAFDLIHDDVVLIGGNHKLSGISCPARMPQTGILL